MAVGTDFKTVLVTGANSFYAAAIMDKLVRKGIKIQAAVRSERAAGPLEKRYGSSVQVFVVPDITTKNAFQESIRGCDAAFHVASPFRHDFNDARTDMLDPAINGALSLLQSAHQEPSIKRVIFTSSIAACLDPTHPSGFKRPGYVYTEKDWNPLTYEKASTFKAFPPVYTASKGLAEKAAWDFMKAEERHFDMVSINPCHTWGAYHQYVGSKESMNFTNADLSRLVDGQEAELPHLIMPWMTDIDEVAQAHVNALFTPEANGRYIVANSRFDFQQVVDVMHENFGNSDWIKNVPKGNPGEVSREEVFTLDNSRSKKDLGVEYRPWKQSVIDFCEKYQEDRKAFPS